MANANELVENNPAELDAAVVTTGDTLVPLPQAGELALGAAVMTHETDAPINGGGGDVRDWKGGGKFQW